MKIKKSQLKELIRQAIVEDIFDKEIKNSKTGNKIKVRTALQLPDEHPSNKKAKDMVAKAGIDKGDVGGPAHPNVPKDKPKEKSRPKDISGDKSKQKNIDPDEAEELGEKYLKGDNAKDALGMFFGDLYEVEMDDHITDAAFGKNGMTNKSIFLLSKSDFLCAKVPSTIKSSFPFFIDTFSEENPILSNLKLRSLTKKLFLL